MENKAVPASIAGLPGRIGLGCMGMSEFYGHCYDATGLRAFHDAWELGYRHFDTADMYGQGHKETLLGRFFGKLGARAGEALLATKVGIRRLPGPTPKIEIDSSPDYIRAACERSLERLGVERISLLNLHRKSPDVPIENSVGAMQDLVSSRQGGGDRLVRSIGRDARACMPCRAHCRPAERIFAAVARRRIRRARGLRPQWRRAGGLFAAGKRIPDRPMGRAGRRGQRSAQAPAAFPGRERRGPPARNAERGGRRSRLRTRPGGASLGACRRRTCSRHPLQHAADKPGEQYGQRRVGFERRADRTPGACVPAEAVAGERYPAALLATVNV